MAEEFHNVSLKFLFQNEPPPRLFHYTTVSGMLGIAKSHTLWATSIQYLNDASELTYFVSALSRHLRARRDKNGVSESERRFCDAFHLATSENVQYRISGRFYVVCLSENKDLLSQWRAYCHPTGGFSIGFDTEPLMSAADMQGFALVKCVYDSAKRLSALDQLTEAYIGMCLQQDSQRINRDLVLFQTDID